MAEMMAAEKESGGGWDSDSLDKKFIIVQTVQTDVDDDPEEKCPISGLRLWNTTGYYMVDLQTGDVSILPRTVQLQDYGRMSSMVALGSKFYIFGRPIKNNSDDDEFHGGSDDEFHGGSSCYFLDLLPDSPKSKSSSGRKWKKAHPLTTDKLPSGGAVAFAGKIYFFRNSDDDDCFCVVFDPSEPDPQWRRIKSTPTPTPAAANNKIDPKLGTGVSPPVLVDHENNRIVVFLGNLSSLFAYYPFEDRWECLVECFVLEGYRRWVLYPGPVTIVDGVIYIHRQRMSSIFLAFDIATQQWLNVSLSSDAAAAAAAAAVRPYKFYLPAGFYVSLLHLGKDVLCLLASRYKGPCEFKTATLIHVVQFKVKLINNNNGTKEVLVTPLSSGSRYYELPSRCGLYHSLAL